MSAGPRVAIVGTFDVENYGDLLFPLVLQRRLRRLVGEVVAVSPAGGPPVWGDCAETVPIAELDQLEIDAIVLGGGNLLHASPWNRELYEAGGLTGALAYPRLWLGAAEAAAKRGIPFCWNAVGVPRPFADGTGKLVAWAAAICERVAVRDEASASYLAGAGIAEGVHVVPDTGLDVASLWSAEEIDAAYAAIFAARGVAVPERTIAIHVNARYAPSVRKLAPLADSLCRRADARALLLALGPCHGDGELARAVAAAMETEPVVVDRPASLREPAAAIARSHAYVGSSLHGMITACSFGVRGLLVASEPDAKLRKFSGFLEQVGLERWLVDSWTRADKRVDKLLASEPEAWASARDRAAGALDAHWSAIAELVGSTGDDSARRRRLEAGQAALERLEELAGGRSAAALYGTIVDELVGELLAEPDPPSRRKRAAADPRRRVIEELQTELRDRLAVADERSERLAGSLHGAEHALVDERARARAEAARLRRDLETAQQDRARARARATVLEEDVRAGRSELDRAAANAGRLGRRLGDLREAAGLLDAELAGARGRAPRLLGRLQAELDSATSTADGLAAAGGSATTAEAASPTSTRRRPRRSPVKVSVLSWDMGHNPLGRAALLADLLSATYEVEAVGAQFERYGTEIWRPLQGSPIPMRTFPGSSFPDHLATMRRVAGELDGDVVYVSKPRFPSFGLGALAKELRNRPLLVDVDDRELSFFGETAGISLDDLAAAHGDPDFLLPFSRLWTRACDALIPGADHVTVSNPALEGLYGGTLVPHVRDETVFDPARFDRDAIRARYGFGRRHRVVLFAGTPRRHKGIVRIAQALDRIGNPDYRLCIVGTKEYEELRRELEPYARWIVVLPYFPFSELPTVLMLADLVCVLQDPANEVARWQIPAKITDALAMGVPCLTTRVPPLESLVQRGLVETLGQTPLDERIDDIFRDHDAARERAVRGRDAFLAEYSYGAVRPRLEQVIDGLLERTPPLASSLTDALRFARSAFAGPDEGPARTDPRPEPVAAPPRPRARARPDDTYDVAVFWKQNDTGIYGRRQDMLVRYLAASDRVRRIVHFDEPIDVDSLIELARSRKEQGAHQADAVLRQTLARITRTKRGGKIAYRTFLHRGARSGRVARLLPAREEYDAFVAACLAEHGIGRRTTVFWVYPRNFDFVRIANALDPDIVLADVVDDHRAWVDPASPYHAKLTRNYEEILARSDIAIANCEPVRRALNEYKEPIHVLPNACEPPGPGRGRRPRELRRLRGPIVGYVGNLSSRIDVDLLEEVATRRPDWNVVLIGSAHLNRDVLRLDRHENVHFLGVKPYDEAKRYVRSFDVGIIPHTDDELTRTMNPLKAFVYLAEGVPVVSTEIANLGALEEVVELAGDADAFVTAVDGVLRRGGAAVDAGARERVLAEHSWPARVEEILGLLDGHRLAL